MVIGDMTKEQMQEQIQQLIRKQEQEIEKLLETKRNTKPDDVLYAICEMVVLQKQKFIAELRSLL
jgi:hypothetical protein